MDNAMVLCYSIDDILGIPRKGNGKEYEKQKYSSHDSDFLDFVHLQ